MSAVKFRKDEGELLQNTKDPRPAVGVNTKPRILTIISNVDRNSREKVNLDPEFNYSTMSAYLALIYCSYPYGIVYNGFN